MKTQKTLSIGILVMFVLTLMAETQTGYVRTIGRNGKPGQPISGVMVRAEGPANMVMSDAQGQFTLTLHEATRDDAYRLASVKKSNYELLDKDVIGREYGFTTVPMEIVLVNLTEMQAEKAAMAERFERQYAETYQKKMAELQAQYEAKQITGEEYATREEELTKALETMLAQIETLVDRYVRTDYDRLDSLDQVINAHIEQGEFDEAERLIRSKGSIQERLADLQEGKEAQRQIEEAQRKIEAANTKKQASLKRDLSLLIDIADAHLRPDSAYFYRKQLAEVDPEDVDVWYELMDGAYFFDEYEMVPYFFNMADSIYKNSLHPDTLEWAKLFDRMGLHMNSMANFTHDKGAETGYEYYLKAKELLCSYFGENSINCADQNELLGLYTSNMSSFYGEIYKDYSKLHYEQAAQIYNNILAQDSDNLKAQYGLFRVQTRGRNGDKEEERSRIIAIYEKAVINPEINDSLIKRMLGYLSAVAPTILTHDEVLHKIMDYYPSHLYDMTDSLSLLCNIANMVGGCGVAIRDEASSRYADSCLNYAIEFAEKEHFGSMMKGNMYWAQKNYDKAIEHYEIELKKIIDIYGLYSRQTLIRYERIAKVYFANGDYESAIECYMKILGINKRLNVPERADVLFELGRNYQAMDDKQHAKEWYEKALKIYQEFNDENGIVNTKKVLNSLKKKKVVKSDSMQNTSLQIIHFL